MTKVVKFDKVDNNFRITIEVDFSRSMLEMENEIQDALNQAGQVLTAIKRECHIRRPYLKNFR